jgi:sterol desaturase/sphingolipid hydroxylase (fatty acid hydroxylase superfamily)
LPLLDAVFGTLHMPRGREPTGYGISDPVPESYPAQLLHPFRR